MIKWESINTCIECLRPSPSPTIEAKSAVVVVPMFDPKVKGYERSTESKPRPKNIYIYKCISF